MVLPLIRLWKGIHHVYLMPFDDDDDDDWCFTPTFMHVVG